jgi:hypothetical protein
MGMAGKRHEFHLTGDFASFDDHPVMAARMPHSHTMGVQLTLILARSGDSIRTHFHSGIAAKCLDIRATNGYVCSA